jgi:flagellar protein FliT
MIAESTTMTKCGRKIIGVYRELESKASRMVALAREQDWETMICEGEAYVNAVAALADMEKECELDEQERSAKYRMLERTLDYDLEIRTCLLEHREELSRLMALSRRERALSQAYGRPVAAAMNSPRLIE